ncbi:25957_t:CDS:1, partial [Gigaspora rosea]
ILALACDAQHANLSTNIYISLLYKILKPQDSLNYLSLQNFILILPKLSFLLLDTQHNDNQFMILEIMQGLIELKLKHINDRDVPPPLVSVAILPLFHIKHVHVANFWCLSFTGDVTICCKKGSQSFIVML